MTFAFPAETSESGHSMEKYPSRSVIPELQEVGLDWLFTIS